MSPAPTPAPIADELALIESVLNGYPPFSMAASDALRACAACRRGFERLEHNNVLLTEALWKACGDDESVVTATIASVGDLR